MTVIPADQRRDQLTALVTDWVARGYRVEIRNDYDAVVSKSKRTSHVLHLLLTIITAGLWIPVWIIVTINNRTRRYRISIDESGQPMSLRT